MFQSINSIQYIIELLGVSVFAISGALSAGRKGLDILGVIVISVVTAIGGGTLRDILLNHHPIFWIDDPGYLIVITIASLLTLFYVRYKRPPRKSLLIADALGLALFTITGTQIAEAANLHPVIIVTMGTITGVAGGVIRDILSAEVPLILRRDIYATAAICGSIIYYLLNSFGLHEPISVIFGIATVMILRLLAIIWGLRLPVFKLTKNPS